MGKLQSFSIAQRETNQNAKTLQRHINKVWNSGVAAPMYRKEVPKLDGNGRQVVKDGMPVVQRRSVRLINGHAYNIACAGAVAAAANDQKKDFKKWGLPYVQSTNHPFMLSVPKGTKLMMEQCLSAYVATAVLKATRMMKAPDTPKHKRLNRLYIQRAFASLNESIQSDLASLRPACIVPLKVIKKGNKDYVPPTNGDPDAAADDAAAAGDEVE